MHNKSLFKLSSPRSMSPLLISSSTTPPLSIPPSLSTLVQEVTDKSERITQLEQEKSALIKQLFEARARSMHDSSTMDSTFI